MHPTLEKISDYKIIPAAVGLDRPETVLPLCDALAAGGLPVLEITLRMEGGLEALRLAVAEKPDMLIGAGTVITAEQAEAVIRAGARYVVSPGLDPSLVRLCQDAGLPMLPGVVTPSEVQAGIGLGLDAVKFFPASLMGGAQMIKTLGGPFPAMKFVPTGGVDFASLPEYLKLGNVLACGGTWMFGRGRIQGGNFEEVTRAARETVDFVTGFQASA